MKERNLTDCLSLLRKIFALIVCLFATVSVIQSQELYPVKLSDQLWHGNERELRYKPEGTDFVITNGNRLFTRALYGTHTAFRVETGDRPEFALYMPGMGGNFKIGIGVNNQSKWLTQAKTITAKYRAGSRSYIIEDSLLGNGKIFLEILALSDAEGFVLKAHLQDVKSAVVLYWAFGGATGKKFSRDGDMGPDPESGWYLKPENCKDNSYALGKGAFTLKYGAGLQVGQDGRYFEEDLNQQSKLSKAQTLVGTCSPDAELKIGDATKLSSPLTFFESSVDKAPTLAGRMNVANNTDYYFIIHNPSTKQNIQYIDAATIFQQAEKSRAQIANRIIINTPDPYINTIGGTLAIASDATWEAPSFLHGAIGWRMRLNGWRGAYTADALGWHDRAKEHLESYALSQITSPASGPIVADSSTNLSRSLEKLGVGMFTSGYISRDPEGKNVRAHHYDMNLVYIDILLRHYDWTGDREFVKNTWPVLKRHLDWEIRNFDADNNGLFDAYAAIWASDAMQYSGGDVTHTSAYNYLAFTRAAEIAKLLGEDATPYQKQADKILGAMNKILWLPKQGHFAEFKDAMGNKLLHPAAGLWTIYHSIDSKVPNSFQAYQCLRYVDHEIPHIPVKAKGLDNGGYYVVSTTNWMPYEWSLNNVVMAENMHTALANWQGGRNEEAFKLFKSQILTDMYLGGSPGNVGQISYYDAVRGESYRDFGDPVGMFSRALVEGLFGILPDALNNKVLIKPGIPSSWNFASFSTPDISFDFKRNGNNDTYNLIPKFSRSLNLTFQVIAQGQVKNITVNGKAVTWKNIDSSVGKPVIEINIPASEKYIINIIWDGAKPVLPSAEKTYTTASVIDEKFSGATVQKIYDPQEVFTDSKITASGFTAKVVAGIGNYTVFAQLKQGALLWWMPICFNVQKTFALITGEDKELNSKSFRLQNNSTTDEQVTVKINSYKTSLKIPAGKISDEVIVPENNLITGTNEIIITQSSNGIIITEKLYNWNATIKGKLETIDMTSFFNDKVTQIFRNKYLSPRPQVTTLQLPWQGIGSWPHFKDSADIDDSGLRKLAAAKNEILLPQGIRFNTPGEVGKNNIMFTSQWDNYPHEKSVTVSGNASHAYFLMAGSTNPMQSQLTNGEIIVQYTDGSSDTLTLRNPETWWPIDQDYYTDGFAFALKQPRPIRIQLQSGNIVSGEESKAKFNGKKIPGGAATVLDMPLNASKTLQAISLKTVANDVVIGMMAITLLR